MAKNQTGIAIVIKAFLPTGATIDEQFAALSIVKDAHASGDYTALLKAAKVDEVKTEQKTRRVEDDPVTTAENTPEIPDAEQAKEEAPSTNTTETDLAGEVPSFLKKGKGKQASENATA